MRKKGFFKVFLALLCIVVLPTFYIGRAYTAPDSTSDKFQQCIEDLASLSKDDGWGKVIMGFFGLIFCSAGFTAECADYYGITMEDLKSLSEGNPLKVDGKTIKDFDELVKLCSSDKDGDKFHDFDDNCVDVKNADQSDQDGDGVGDICDDTPCPEGESLFDGMCKPDIDGDGIPDAIDNCKEEPNTQQNDRDQDGVGNICDPIPCLDNELYDKSQDKCVVSEVEDDVNIADEGAVSGMDFSDGCSITLSSTRHPALGLVVILTTLALLLTVRYKKE